MIPEALEHFCPGKQYSVNGDTYEGIIPLNGSPMPTKEQVEEWLSQIGPIIKNRKIEQDRSRAYAKESDPLFFKWQRGEATEQDYLAKVEEIRARYPYV